MNKTNIARFKNKEINVKNIKFLIKSGGGHQKFNFIRTIVKYKKTIHDNKG